MGENDRFTIHTGRVLTGLSDWVEYGEERDHKAGTQVSGMSKWVNASAIY